MNGYFAPPPKVTLDKDATLRLLNDERAIDTFMNDRDHWEWKSEWLCELLNEREKVAGYQYNSTFQLWFEKEFNVGPFAENGSVLSLLVYNAQGFRRSDRLVAEGFAPCTTELLKKAFQEKKKVELYHDGLLGSVRSTLTVREIDGVYYMMQRKSRTRGYRATGQPVRISDKRASTSKRGSVYDEENFSGRVNYAAQCIMRGTSGTRHFDTCFQMGDGDAVVTALVRRARDNPRLYEAIAKQWGGKFPQSWIDTAEEHKAVKTCDLRTIKKAY